MYNLWLKPHEDKRVGYIILLLWSINHTVVKFLNWVQFEIHIDEVVRPEMLLGHAKLTSQSIHSSFIVATDWTPDTKGLLPI